MTNDPFNLPVIQHDLAFLKDILDQQIVSDVPTSEVIARYLVIDQQGKLLRPTLMLILAHALIPINQHYLKIACAIEYCHNATLLHDDVLDDSDLRRGQLTAKAKWHNIGSILAGDFLLMRAFEIINMLESPACSHLFTQAIRALMEGEMLQLVQQRGEVTPSFELYEKTIGKKTASLFKMGFSLCALSATNVSEEIQNHVGQFGYYLGMCFQVIDDIIDWNTSQEIGKTQGNDFKEGKWSLPILCAQAILPKKSFKLIQIQMGQPNISEEALLQIKEILIDCGAMTESHKRAKAFSELALTHLKALPSSIYQDALFMLTEQLLKRPY